MQMWLLEFEIIPKIANIKGTNEMKMWSVQLYHNLCNCKINPPPQKKKNKKIKQVYRWIRTHGLCIRAAVLYHLSYMKTTGSNPGEVPKSFFFQANFAIA